MLSVLVLICFLGSAAIINGTATVTIRGLRCEETYSIKAGGLLNLTPLGPRFHRENVTALDCPVPPAPPGM